MIKAKRFKKPDTLTRIERDRHVVIEASAGTGKTFTLEHLIIELLLGEPAIPIEKILVVTFTEKATSELVARVRAKLEEILADGWESAPEETPAWAITDEARARLEAALFAFDTASISTIHSFCQRVLTEHAFANRRLFEQTAVDQSRAFEVAFRDVLRRDLASDPQLLPWLTAWLSVDSIEALEKLLLECHKAGCPLRPEFDPIELQSAIEAFPEIGPEVGSALAGVNKGTIKAILARFTELTALCERFRESGDVAEFLIAAGAVDFAYLTEKLELFAGRGAAEVAVHAALRIASSSVSLEVVVAQLFAARVGQHAQAQKVAAGQFDFQDMLSLVKESLESEHGEELAATLRRRFQAALIDEFQDTDDIQWAIFKRIFVDQPASETPRCTLFVIGDPKQAIYGFRGADVQTYLSARASLGEPLPLTENFRSTPKLVAAYNEVFEQNARAPFFSGGKIDYRHPVTAGLKRLVALGPDDLAVTPIHLFGLTSAKGDLKAGAVRRALGDRIAREIKLLLDPKRPAVRFGEGPGGSPERPMKPIAPKDIFILTRTAREGYLVGEQLRAHGIAHAYYKQDGLFERPEAEYVLALLRAIADPHPRSTRFRAFLTPFFALSLPDLDGLGELPPEHPLMQRLLDWNALAGERDFARLFSSILEGSGIVRRELFQSESERELTNYLHLFEILLEEASRTHATLDDLCRTLASFIDGTALPEGENGGVQRLETDRAAVQIMTIHKAKGLEASVVFLFGGFSPWDPSSVHVFHDEKGQRLAWVGSKEGVAEAAINKEAREEEQRLLYVALTRARARLYLPYFREVTKTDSKGVEKQGEEFSRLNGVYRQLNDRLRAIVAAPSFPASPSFSLEEVPVERAALCEDAAAETALDQWSASADLADPFDEQAEQKHFEQLRRDHAGFVITSYSTLKRSHGGGYRAATGDKDEAAEEPDDAAPSNNGEALRGGKNTGNFLHSLLEEIPLESLAARVPGAPASVEEWGESDLVKQVFLANLGRYGIEERHLAESRRLVHGALTARVALPSGEVIAGLVSAHPKMVREMEFLFPIPEDSHPRLTATLGEHQRFEIKRGFIRGFVDLVFQHGGLTYLVDWKSDSLPRWDRATVDAHVQRNYSEQAQLYSLALVKMLGVHDQAGYEGSFGGYVYCFLRGMREGGKGSEGIFARRPEWSQILAWEHDLLRSDLLGEART